MKKISVKMVEISAEDPKLGGAIIKGFQQRLTRATDEAAEGDEDPNSNSGRKYLQFSLKLKDLKSGRRKSEPLVNTFLVCPVKGVGNFSITNQLQFIKLVSKDYYIYSGVISKLEAKWFVDESNNAPLAQYLGHFFIRLKPSLRLGSVHSKE